MKTLSLDGGITASSWVDLVETRAERDGDRVIYTFLDENGREAGTLTYRELDARARAIAHTLTGRCAPGDRALLLYPAGLDYITAFFGCLYAGVIAVPLFTPARHRCEQIDTIAADCTAAVVLTTEAIASALGAERDAYAFAALPAVATDVLAPVADSSAPRPEIGGETVAYLQYTSGSTSTPKGVIIDHAISLRICLDMAVSWQMDRDSVVTSWLPHFHDFGQVSGVLTPVYVGCRAVLMAPSTFVKEPIRWLEAVTRYGGTHSGAPNFSFDLCVDKTTPQQRAELDLSTWQMVCNGAEPVRKATLDRFEETFAPHGLSGVALSAGYGLAEATLKVTCGQASKQRVVTRFDLAALGRRRAEPITEGEGLDLVGAGTVTAGTEIAIVEPESGRRLRDGEVGEIWVVGPAIAPGYWGRPEESERTFGARIAGAGDTRWLRTGDLGFQWEDELFICGRVKNLMIVNGVNYYPEDIEATAVASTEALHPGGTLAFGVDEGEQEKLVLVAEYRPGAEAGEPESVAAAVHAAVARRHDIAPAAVVLITPGTVPRTTSGKLRRQACKADFLAHRLAEICRFTAPVVTETPAAVANSNGATSMRDLVRQGLLVQVGEWIAANMGPDAPALEPDRSLAEHGLGSVQQMQLHEELETWAGKQFLPELMWNASSIDDMVFAIADALTRITTDASVVNSTEAGV